MTNFRQIANTNAGFLLLEAVVTVGILASLILFALYQSNMAFGSMQKQRSSASRDKIVSTVERYAMLLSGLRNSLLHTANADLSLCTTPIYSFVPFVHGDCVNGVLRPLQLYGPVVKFDADGAVDAVTSSAISDGPGHPGLFNSWGEPCGPGMPSSSLCPFEVTTEWKPQCPLDSATSLPALVCDVAEIIEIKYSIAVAKGVTDPSFAHFSKVTGSVAVQVYDITGLKPSIDATVIPMPPPPPPPTPTPIPDPFATPIPGPAPTPIADTNSPNPIDMQPSTPSSPTPTPIPYVPASCPGNTVRTGPKMCSCPPGESLVNPAAGICKRISI
jgi:hypothetical protein